MGGNTRGGLSAAYGIARRTILDSKNRAKSAGFMLLHIDILRGWTGSVPDTRRKLIKHHRVPL